MARIHGDDPLCFESDRLAQALLQPADERRFDDSYDDDEITLVDVVIDFDGVDPGGPVAAGEAATQTLAPIAMTAAEGRTTARRPTPGRPSGWLTAAAVVCALGAAWGASVLAPPRPDRAHAALGHDAERANETMAVIEAHAATVAAVVGRAAADIITVPVTITAHVAGRASAEATPRPDERGGLPVSQAAADRDIARASTAPAPTSTSDRRASPLTRPSPDEAQPPDSSDLRWQEVARPAVPSTEAQIPATSLRPQSWSRGARLERSY